MGRLCPRYRCRPPGKSGVLADLTQSAGLLGFSLFPAVGIVSAREIDDRDILRASLEAMRHDLDAAKANAEQAKFDFERAKQNYNAKILSEAELQKTKSTYDTAQANLSAARQRLQESGANLAASRDSLSKTTVSAPIAGVVTYLPVKEGEVTVIGTMNNPGTQLLTISDMSEVEAVMMVDETSVPDVKVGQKANLNIDAYPNRTFEGVVTEVGSSPIAKNDPDLLSLTQGSEAINFKVKLRVTNPPETIRPGFSVTADILTGRKEGATAIPIQALVVRDVPKKDGKAATSSSAAALATALHENAITRNDVGVDATGREVVTNVYSQLNNCGGYMMKTIQPKLVVSLRAARSAWSFDD